MKSGAIATKTPEVLVALAIALPWLNFYTVGPTPNAWPWLISAFCAVIVWLFRRRLNGLLIAGAWRLAAGCQP